VKVGECHTGRRRFEIVRIGSNYERYHARSYTGVAAAASSFLEVQYSTVLWANDNAHLHCAPKNVDQVLMLFIVEVC